MSNPTACVMNQYQVLLLALQLILAYAYTVRYSMHYKVVYV